MSRLLSEDAAVHLLDVALPAGSEVVAGTPTARLASLGTVGATEVGLWEMTEGTARDVEADEVFVVLAGHATLRFDDGETLDLRPGVVVRLTAGDRTEWTVHAPLRKLYVTPEE